MISVKSCVDTDIEDINLEVVQRTWNTLVVVDVNSVKLDKKFAVDDACREDCLGYCSC